MGGRLMKKTRYWEKRIAFARRRTENGAPMLNLCCVYPYCRVLMHHLDLPLAIEEARERARETRG